MADVWNVLAHSLANDPLTTTPFCNISKQVLTYDLSTRRCPLEQHANTARHGYSSTTTARAGLANKLRALRLADVSKRRPIFPVHLLSVRKASATAV
jgi:hypothetical protein